MRIRKTGQTIATVAQTVNEYSTGHDKVYDVDYINNMSFETEDGGIGGDTLPVGSMIPYGNATPPTNWLLCDGSAVSRTTYAELFAVIGTSYGAGDGSTTFNLPNKKGRVSVGLDTNDTDFNSIGKKGGEKKHTLTTNEMPSHNHGVFGALTGENKPVTNTGNDWGVATTEQWTTPTSLTGGSQPHNNIQPFEVDCWIIKAFKSATIKGEITNQQDEGSNKVYSVNYINEVIENNKVKNNHLAVSIPDKTYSLGLWSALEITQDLTELFTIGDGIVFEDNKIKITENADFQFIDFNMFMKWNISFTSAAGNRGIYFYKNGVRIYQGFNSCPLPETMWYSDTYHYLIDVVPGDYFTIAIVRGGEGGTINSHIEHGHIQVKGIKVN